MRQNLGSCNFYLLGTQTKTGNMVWESHQEIADFDVKER
jgi:hypothetical protein